MVNLAAMARQTHFLAHDTLSDWVQLQSEACIAPGATRFLNLGTHVDLMVAN